MPFILPTISHGGVVIVMIQAASLLSGPFSRTLLPPLITPAAFVDRLQREAQMRVCSTDGSGRRGTFPPNRSPSAGEAGGTLRGNNSGE